MKKIVLLFLTSIMILGSTGNVFAETMMIPEDGKYIWVDGDSEEVEPIEVQAKPASQKITVDGKLTSFREYNIGGYNYFMLRDLAYIFNGTKAQFEVSWDQVKFAINLETGKVYTGKGEGFDMKTPHIEETGYKSRATIYKDGKEAVLLGYTIQGYTYFKLRDLGNEMGFGVKWDDENQTVVLLSDKNAETPVATAEQKQDMRERMLVLINKARKEAGVNPLILDSNLAAMSEYKAADLQKTGILSHDGTYGCVLDLARIFNESAVGENILMNGMSVEDMFNMWWNSPKHRANMLYPDYKRIGIGFAENKVITKAVSIKFSDLDQYAYNVQYNEIMKQYYITGMGYWAVQNFGF